MKSKHVILEDELTPEGREIWENMSSYNKQTKPPLIFTNKKEKISGCELELEFITTELKKMIINSELVIKDCKVSMASIKTKEEYILSDAKIAIRIHTKLKERLENILKLVPAFDDDKQYDNRLNDLLLKQIDDEEPNKLFVDTFKNINNNSE